MACDSGGKVDFLLDSDRRTVRTYWILYSLIFVASALLYLFWNSHPVKDTHLPDYVKLFPEAIAVPLVFKHFQRAEAIRLWKFYKGECEKYPAGDPECERIRAKVEVVLEKIGKGGRNGAD